MIVAWRPRETPLLPRCVVARGAEVCRKLLDALLARDDAALAMLMGVAGSDIVLVEGDAEALPWVDGVTYLGTDPLAPGVLLPTALQPTVPSDLLAHAVLKRCEQSGTGPVAILAAPTAFVPVGAARPLARQALIEARAAVTP